MALRASVLLSALITSVRGVSLLKLDAVLSELANPKAWNADVPQLTDVPVLSDDIWYTPWSLCDAKFKSNLGGSGPDFGVEESIRYKKVGQGKTADGTKIKFDLVVTANSRYIPNDANINGLGLGGCFGVVNVESNKGVDLLFSFYETGTNNSIALNKFFFTVFDLDTNKDGSAAEAITLYSMCDEVYTAPASERKFDMTGNLSTGLTCTATSFGAGSDNPKKPEKITNNQKKKAVMIQFVEKSQWKVTFSVVGSGGGGRNFAFASMTNMGPGAPTVAPTVATTPKPETTPKITTTGTGDPRSAPTPLPTPAPTTTTTSCATQACVVYADPHVSGFDNTDNQGPANLALIDWKGSGADQLSSRLHTFDMRPIDVDAYDTGDFWLVKSELVHIQARFRLSGEFVPDKAAVGAVAVGGPFLDGHTLVVEPLDGLVTFDGAELTDGTSSHRDGLVTVTNNIDSGDVRAELPMSVVLELKRLNQHIDVKIIMPPPDHAIDGECGNYDGIAENDDEEAIQSRMGSLIVADSDRLFATKFVD